jgi:hypothetical protein
MNRAVRPKRQRVEKPKIRAAAGHGSKMLLHRKTQGCNVKERQASKIKELAHVLESVGFVSLDDQAKALGISRSTTWTILKAQHKNYGLSATLIKRMLAKTDLNPRIRAKLIEYVRERAAGSFGHNDTQLRRFSQLLAGVTTQQCVEAHVRPMRRASGRN